MLWPWEYAILSHADLLSDAKGLEGQDRLVIQLVKPLFTLSFFKSFCNPTEGPP